MSTCNGQPILKEKQNITVQMEPMDILKDRYTELKEPYWELLMAIVNRAKEDLLSPSAERFRSEIRDFFTNGLIATVTDSDFGLWAYEQLEKKCESIRRQKNGVF